MNLRVNRPDEDLILLSQVADIRMIKGPMQISREQTQRRVTIGINVRNRDVESFIGEVNEVLTRDLALPPGYYISYGGQFENLESAKQTSAIAVPISLAAIFILLFFAFGSIKQSTMIFTAIPLAAVGGIWALVFRGMPFSISAGVGFIALFGIAVLNGIVLISHYNQLEKEGVTDIITRIRQGTSDRLRPVVMTSLVAALGFLPMAISGAAGAEVQKPLASVVIGGILTSSFLTLVVLPVLYLIFNDGFSCYLQQHFKRKKMVPNKTVLVILMIFSTSAFSLRVTAQESTSQELTMKRATEIAILNNPQVKNIDLRVQSAKKLIKSAIDIPSPTLLVEDGMINSSLSDYKITLAQEIAFPVVYVKQAKVQKLETRLTSTGAEMEMTAFISEVKTKYMNWWTSVARRRILEQQDSIYINFFAASRKQFEAGSINQLTLLLTESKAFKVQNQLKEAQILERISEDDLRLILCTAEPFEAPSGIPGRLLQPSLPVVNPELNPNVRYLSENADLQKAILGKESWSAAPSFSVGWFTQSIDQLGNYNGFQYGLSIPLWFWVPMGRIQSAKINCEIAANDYDFGKKRFTNMLDRLRKLLEKQTLSLGYYEKTALKQSALMIETAEKSYKAGEIDYFQYIISLGEAFSLQVDYLSELENYNKTVIDITNLMGE
jgi:cobalt-zinc-cadmium resistance protein CzcA